MKTKLLIDSTSLLACSVGFLCIMGRTIELLTYAEFKYGVILAFGLGFTAYALNKLSSKFAKGNRY
jgi:hypothetical protein